MNKFFSQSLLLVFTFVFLFSQPAFAKRKSYWLEGGIVGGVLGATVGGLAVAASSVCDVATERSCSSTEDKVLGVVGFTTIGFGAGALIGLLFKKKESGDQAYQITPTIFVDPNKGNFGVGAGMHF